jgi:glutathione S-transferase
MALRVGTCREHSYDRGMRFVDLEEARSSPGVRLVVGAGLPSPYSEAAKGVLKVKGIDTLLVRFSRSDDALKQWTGWHNAPVLRIGEQPPLTHWSEILGAAERLCESPSLVPADAEERVRMFGFSHELLGDGGLAWNARLLVIDRRLTTGGREGFPLRLAQYLAPKYGHAPERIGPANANMRVSLARFAELARQARAHGHPYLLGGRLTVLDVYLASTLGVISPMPPEQCPGLLPAIRHALESAAPGVRAGVPAILLEHRDFMYERHLGLPVEL